MSSERRRRLENAVTTLSVASAILRPAAPAVLDLLHRRICATDRTVTTQQVQQVERDLACAAVELAQERLRDRSNEAESMLAEHLEQQRQLELERRLRRPIQQRRTPQRRRRP